MNCYNVIFDTKPEIQHSHYDLIGLKFTKILFYQKMTLEKKRMW